MPEIVQVVETVTGKSSDDEPETFLEIAVAGAGFAAWAVVAALISQKLAIFFWYCMDALYASLTRLSL